MHASQLMIPVAEIGLDDARPVRARSRRQRSDLAGHVRIGERCSRCWSGTRGPSSSTLSSPCVSGALGLVLMAPLLALGRRLSAVERLPRSGNAGRRVHPRRLRPDPRRARPLADRAEAHPVPHRAGARSASSRCRPSARRGGGALHPLRAGRRHRIPGRCGPAGSRSTTARGSTRSRRGSISISVSAFTTWRLNRSLTFGASDRSQATEGLRYALVAALTARFNYCLYALALLAWPDAAADRRRHRRDARRDDLLLCRLFALRICGRGDGARPAELAEAIAAAAERHVEMEMRGVRGVRARPEHRREIVAGAFADLRLEFRLRRPGFVPPIPDGIAVGKTERGDVDRVRVRVLADLLLRIVVAGAADIGRVMDDPCRRSPEIASSQQGTTTSVTQRRATSVSAQFRIVSGPIETPAPRVVTFSGCGTGHVPPISIGGSSVKATPSVPAVRCSQRPRVLQGPCPAARRPAA